MSKQITQQKYLFVSIKPEFAQKIVAKEKSIELRKMRPHVSKGDYIIIYSSSPVQSVIGFGLIKSIIETSPSEMWAIHHSKLGIDEERFNKYYINTNKAIGIEVESIKKVEPINLKTIKKVIPHFHPPQIYRYVERIDIRNILKNNL
ncbi:MAG: hypothetical protein SNJ29_10165 [Rikenellaceae bacterium]